MLSAQLPDLNNFSAATHPDLMQYAAKRRALEIERKLKNEKRKPVLNVNYALLGNQWTFFPTAGLEGPSVVANDMKWGVNIYYPLLNRKARGDYDLTKIKISQTDLNIQQKIREITTKTGQYITEANTLLAQVNTFRQITDNYRTLLDAEIEKFAQGESSVFLINTREQRWLDARLKYLKLVAEWKKAEAGAKWAAGQL
jgi:outer membrane protein TolC